MIEIEAEERKKVRCFLIYDYGTCGNELQGLTDTLNMETAGSLTLPKKTESQSIARFGIGTGKAQEIATAAQETQAECIIFDFEITPTRQRNWEKLCNIPVFDRQEVILRIFASRAKTKEANLQVELASLTYSLPRLAHSYGDMARQRGGSYGSKGAGETKLELDRRTIQSRIVQVKKELSKVVRERETQRKKRGKIPLPSCAIVGYTNAGKSSLLNALTGANVLAENKLFATLDPTTRRLGIAGGTQLLLTDTVGFISNLPHNLIDAFKSTLEEAVQGDLLLIVVDASDPAAYEQYKTVCRVLEEIGATESQRIIVLNKIDLLNPVDIRKTTLKQQFPRAIYVSAKNNVGLDQLSEAICNSLSGREQLYRIPYHKQELLELVRKNGTVTNELWLEDYIEFTGRTATTQKLAKQLAPYQVLD